MTIQKTTAPNKALCQSTVLWSKKYFSIINITKYTIDAIEAVKKGLFLSMIPK